MLKKLVLLLSALMGLVTQAPAWAKDDDNLLERLQHKLHAQAQIGKFSIAHIYLEQNFTDGETEVVIMAKGGDSGLRRFWLLAPDGKPVYEFKSPNNGRNIGGREILVESPEPPELEKILSAYPKGAYTFIGESFAGEWLYSRTALSHNIPAPATVTFPTQDSTVSRHALTVSWVPVAGAVSYIVELKNKSTGRKLEAQIAGDQNVFQAPAGWIAPNANYQVVVVAINRTGNRTAVELTFFTATE